MHKCSGAFFSAVSRAGLYIIVGKSQNKRLLYSLTQSNVSSGILFSEQIQPCSHPQFNGLAAGSKEMKNCVAASNACTFISTSKPMGGALSQLSSFSIFCSRWFDGCRMLYVMRRALSVTHREAIISVCGSRKSSTSLSVHWATGQSVQHLRRTCQQRLSITLMLCCYI